jgi:hypothetical protein
MPSDLKEIFDLARLRRAWGDQGAGPPGAPPSTADGEMTVGEDPQSPPVRKPLQILELLVEAVRSEFPTHAAALSYHLDILRDRLAALVGDAAPGAGRDSSPGNQGELPTELATAYHADVQEHLDQLEDLIDALSLPARSGE